MDLNILFVQKIYLKLIQLIYICLYVLLIGYLPLFNLHRNNYKRNIFQINMLLSSLCAYGTIRAVLELFENQIVSETVPGTWQELYKWRYSCLQPTNAAIPRFFPRAALLSLQKCSTFSLTYIKEHQVRHKARQITYIPFIWGYS